ncbi:hypothetical protein EV189_3611 [Motilibacter rhizosphaerae]|uniref:Glyoxalase-like domain-containing protein n=1 Tax=Motilibacter rhizosphaerae TaxID=598652 RepID=A0A4Q7NBC7_9ACTN|nr:VOC family protein [Motilibacter rhizosphaerae]RZS80130.1 hypothetical protein EV189_3611 [Motilibacter rhizosphaerae]
MPLRLSALALDSRDPVLRARFWGALLPREVVRERTTALLPGTERQVGLRFVPGDAPAPEPARVHLHVTSTSEEQRDVLVTTALDLGGRHLDVGQLPEERHIVLADPEGAAFCVIEPENSFLAGCGPLGELACDGTREVGVFWSRALNWPLVWDSDGETAVQSPAGGTKVAWGGPPVAPKHGRSRQRLELVADDLAGEVERLVADGAVRLGTLPGGAVELADPDGNEFVVADEDYWAAGSSRSNAGA